MRSSGPKSHGHVECLTQWGFCTADVARRAHADAREETLQEVASRNPVATTLAFVRARENVAANAVVGRTCTPGGKARERTAGRPRGAFGVATWA